MMKLYKNWHFHNIVGHPLAHISSLFFGKKAFEYIHDGTLPEKISKDEKNI